MNNKRYVDYHDFEWGVAKYDDQYLFELLILEMFQAGLSWECILNKRESFKKAFDDFDVLKVSKYDDNKIIKLINNKNIIRNKLKIKAAIENAKVFIKIQNECGSFSKYIWSFTNNEVVKNKDDIIKTTSQLSDNVSSSLRQYGMKFVGSTIIYSYLQAIGIIDDHELNCKCYNRRII